MEWWYEGKYFSQDGQGRLTRGDETETVRKEECYREKSSKWKGPEMGMGLASLRHKMKASVAVVKEQGWDMVGPDG